MMSKNQERDRNQIDMITIDELVPKDHRKIIERHIWEHHVEEADHLVI